MKKLIYTVAIWLIAVSCLFGQARTNYNSKQSISEKGKFNKNYRTAFHSINPPDTSRIIANEQADRDSREIRPFRFAEPISMLIDLKQKINWLEDSSYLHGRIDIEVKNAKSLSFNYGKFYLPEGSSMYIYNKNGEMITGPVTSSENNQAQLWGSSVYKGDLVSIEVRVMKASLPQLKLVIDNVAYGYKQVFATTAFGESAPCNINVLCPLGNGWAQERNSVTLILNQNGSRWCSGALINNTCNINIPYLLTANHCLNSGSEDVSKWRFMFQYWSPQCNPNQDNTNSLLFNGSVLRANSDPSDFALLQLTQTPAANSGITYGGWNRNTVAAQNTVAIHHPEGDVMKIATDANAPITVSWMGGANNHWRVHFQQGTVEPGSSGSPLFDQNHRIVGQLHGNQNTAGNFCTEQIGEYGKFDVSWAGGGTAATRLSDWLDPLNSGAMTTNTINVANILADFRNTTVTGTSPVCSVGSYTSSNPAGTTVAWSSSNSSALSLTSAQGVNPASFSRQNNFFGQVNVTATVSGGACSTNVSKNVEVGVTSADYTINCSSCVNGYLSYCLNTTYSFGIGGPGGSNYQWTIPQGWQSLYVSGNAAVLRSPSTSNPPTGTLSCTFTDLCGVQETKSLFTAYSCHQTPSVAGSSTLTTFPNPASSTLTIQVIDSTANNSSEQLQQSYQVILYNRMTQTVYSIQSSDKSIQIPVSGLPDDIYCLNVFYKDGVLQRQIIVKK